VRKINVPKNSLRLGGEVYPAEAFAKGGNSDENKYLLLRLRMVSYLINKLVWIAKNH
jgi:hypothetical protein